MPIEEARKLAVARQLVAVGRSLSAFNFRGEQYLSRTMSDTMTAAERAFSADDLDRAEHLAKVVAFLVRREAPKFAANPKAWIKTRRGCP